MARSLTAQDAPGCRPGSAAGPTCGAARKPVQRRRRSIFGSRKRLFYARFIAFFLSIGAFAPLAAAFDLQGHRGARGLMPENTLPAFERALTSGANWAFNR